MKNESAHIAPLISKYICGTLTVEEETDLQAWLSESEEHQKLFDYLRENDDRTLADLEFFRSLDVDASWKRFLKETNYVTPPSMVRRLIRYAVAALIAISVGWIYLAYRDANNRAGTELVDQRIGDVLPGGSKATLILSDSRQVELTAGAVALNEQDGTTISTVAGALQYKQLRKGKQAELIYNTLLVPKAGMYRLTLSDGTRVWVNALSELRFPVQFGRDKRKVSLSGEAYFEVSHDANRPFLVEVDGNVVEVLGTRFNISSYSDVKATLVEGSVKVVHGEEAAILKPGQEANIADAISVKKADIQKATAWKNGDFYFKSDPIHEIMGQLSRWYDLSVKYQGTVPKQLGYNGRIKRDVNLSEVLSMLSFATGAEFTIADSREVTVNYSTNQQKR